MKAESVEEEGRSVSFPPEKWNNSRFFPLETPGYGISDSRRFYGHSTTEWLKGFVVSYNREEWGLPGECLLGGEKRRRNGSQSRAQRSHQPWDYLILGHIQLFFFSLLFCIWRFLLLSWTGLITMEFVTDESDLSQNWNIPRISQLALSLLQLFHKNRFINEFCCSSNHADTNTKKNLPYNL